MAMEMASAASIAMITVALLSAPVRLVLTSTAVSCCLVSNVTMATFFCSFPFPVRNNVNAKQKFFMAGTDRFVDLWHA
jgi:hypothetical protein